VGNDATTHFAQLTSNASNETGLNVVFESGLHVKAPYQFAITTYGHVPLVHSPFAGAFAHWKWERSISDSSINQHSTTNALLGDPVEFGVDDHNGKPLSYVTFSGRNHLNVELSSCIGRKFTIAGWFHANDSYLPCLEFNGEDHAHIIVNPAQQEVQFASGRRIFNTPVTATVWTHFAYVSDGTTLYIYINGVQVQPLVKTNVNLISTVLHIGFDHTHASTGTKLGELIVLKAPVSAPQIKQIYDRIHILQITS